MLKNDAFSAWLGVELAEISTGICELTMITRAEMLNGFKILHGGISYSLADSALAFAANSLGKHSLSVDTSIAHHVKVSENEKIRATARPLFLGKKVSTFEVLISNCSDELIASFKGTVYHTDRQWEFE